MKIYKYKLEFVAEQTLALPKDAQILCADIQHKQPQLWALVDPEAPTEARRFHVYGTGHPIEADNLVYIDTFFIGDGLLVFHVFEEILP